MQGEFSAQTRKHSIERFQKESFDLLIIGGGITGAAVARDACSRGLKVALVERRDFAFGTSSRSSKLIHGGLRYLQKFQLGLVFEALAERSFLLKTMPNRVKPLPFYFPIYKSDPISPTLLAFGLWLYDLLALFRTPEFHQSLSREKLIQEIPFLKEEALISGFKYSDASMWDDVLAVETIRAAQRDGVAAANYFEAVEPVWQDQRITGFKVRDLETPSEPFEIKASRVVVCAGPWTDQVGGKLGTDWKRWLKPSKGVHLIFDLKRIPIPGAMVMSHPGDGRVAFVVPRPDFGPGIVLVGTTDSPTTDDPDRSEVEKQDVQYLMNLLEKYFPKLKLQPEDILSAYVGVRPLMGDGSSSGDKSAGESASVLQKVSREHHIGEGPGGTIVVAGGKYTTHRRMAQEIVDFTLDQWKREFKKNAAPALPEKIGRSKTKTPLSTHLTLEETGKASQLAEQKGIKIPPELLDRYGADALQIVEWEKELKNHLPDPEGFPCLKAQLKYAIRKEMVLHLEDFYIRRVPLYLARKDGGLPWAESLAKVWAEERGLGEKEAALELEKLKNELAQRSKWRNA